MDAISKYYAISEVLNDNLRDVAIAIRIAGCPHKPARIFNDLSESWVDKYVEEFEFLMDVIKTPQSKYLLIAYIRDMKKLSHKFNFSMTHETHIGAINPNYVRKAPKVKELYLIEHEDNHKVQMLIRFEGDE